jgi:cysteine desulfurase
LSLLNYQSTGKIDPLKLEKAIRPDTVLVSVIYGNNEIGTLNPIAKVGEICRSNQVLFHTDAAQAFGKVKIDVKAQNIDLMSISAHKIYGPKGVGALFVRRGGRAFPFEPILFGGQQEHGLRPGTLNVPGIVGFGKAAELAASRLDIDSKMIAELRDYLWIQIQKKIQGCQRNGDEENSLPNNLSVTIEGVPADPLMMQLRDFAFSTGSACSSADTKPSRVLLSIGLSPERAKSTIRLGLGRGNTVQEVDRFVKELSIAVEKIRSVQNLGDQYYGKANSVNG